MLTLDVFTSCLGMTPRRSPLSLWLATTPTPRSNQPPFTSSSAVRMRTRTRMMRKMLFVPLLYAW